MGTRFIATDECFASAGYKQSIVDAEEDDIVHSERLTGVPVAVINTPPSGNWACVRGPWPAGCFAGGVPSIGCARSTP